MTSATLQAHHLEVARYHSTETGRRRSFSATMKTTPDVFIIESLRFKDETRGHLEGRFISHILKLAERKVRYRYIRTRAELEELLEQFDRSGFRYLHVSCHANPDGVALTLDELSIKDMGQVFRPHLKNRRIFFSACKIATPALAETLLNGTGCYSVIGPSKSVDFDEAALFWASLYHLMFKNEAVVMKRDELKRNIVKLSKVFELGVKFFSASTKSKKGFTEIEILG